MSIDSALHFEEQQRIFWRNKQKHAPFAKSNVARTELLLRVCCTHEHFLFVCMSVCVCVFVCVLCVCVCVYCVHVCTVCVEVCYCRDMYIAAAVCVYQGR